MWQTYAARKIGGNIEHSELFTISGQDLCVIQNYETGTIYPKGHPKKIDIRVTGVYRKEHNEWKMVSYQTDHIPILLL